MNKKEVLRAKYIGMVFEGRWEVICFVKYNSNHHGGSGKFLLRNIYNSNEIEIKDTTLRRIVKGETTISKVISGRLNRKKIAFEYAKKREKIMKA